MGFPRQEYWNGLLLPPPGDLPYPGIEPVSLTSPALPGGLFTTSTAWEAPIGHQVFSIPPLKHLSTLRLPLHRLLTACIQALITLDCSFVISS